MCSVTEQSGDPIRPGDNVLVCCPSFTREEPRACLDLLTPEGSTDVHALSVLFTQSPGDHVDTWQRIAGACPTRMRIVAVDADADARSNREVGAADADRAVERVGSPHNLTRLGVRITDYLDEWDSSTDRRIVVCFQSLTALLQYVDLESAVAFLEVVTARCAATGAVAHYHLDPEAHDEATIDRLSELFETALAFDDGEWTSRAGGD